MMSKSLLLFCAFSFLFHLNALDTTSAPIRASNPEPHPYGFYKGVFLLSMTGGNPFYLGGDLLEREKDIQGNISTRSEFGLTPVKALGFTNIPHGFSFPNSQFKNSGSYRGFFEYGITDNIGLGFSISSLSMDVVNNRENINYPSLIQNQGLVPPTTYIEATPSQNNFYSDQTYAFTFSYHFLSQSRIDPFLYGEVGLVNFSSTARNLQQSYLFDSGNSRGTGFGTRAGAGLNFFLTPEFGLQLEISGQKKWIRSDVFGSSQLESMQIQMGIIFNFENISKYSSR